ncbi:hypothetical protein NM688_g4110 [Phlebia brevispora]|uniref:Uncharacterized protein n=1 Tax=Phlebia brevispora TaxID=194682 RepID=A0ACC1T3T8_9APHY|nr:hypothetical protein NM688_g4110 [Phlebia brevispora]
MTNFKLTPAIHRNLDTLWTKIQRLHLRSDHSSPTDAGPKLPPELTDNIIDHLRHDKDALTSCSLVCTSFLNRSFYRLYRTVSMRDTKRFRRFIAFLPTSTMRRYIEVVLLGNGGSIDAAAANRLRLDLASLSSLLDALPALKVLELNCLSWIPRVDDIGTITPKSVKALVLDDVRSSESGVHLVLSELIPLLRLFATIGKLNLGNFHGHLPVSSSLRPGVRTRTLQVHNLDLQADSANAPILQFLRTTGSTKTLKVVHIDAVDKATLIALGGLLRDAKAAISILQVDVTNLGPPHSKEYTRKELARRVTLPLLTYVPAERLCKALDIPSNLAGCTSLRTLRFWITMSDGLGTVGMWHWRFFFAFLTDAVANLPNVEYMMICISLGKNPKDAVMHARDVDWTKLEYLLRKFPRLGYIGFGTPSPRKRNDDLRSIDNKLWKIAKKRMPVLHASRVLRWKNTYTN